MWVKMILDVIIGEKMMSNISEKALRIERLTRQRKSLSDVYSATLHRHDYALQKEVLSYLVSELNIVETKIERLLGGEE